MNSQFARLCGAAFVVLGCTPGGGGEAEASETGAETGDSGGVVLECVPPEPPAFNEDLGAGRWDDFEGSGFWDATDFDATTALVENWADAEPTVPYTSGGATAKGALGVHMVHLPGGRLLMWEGRLDQRVYDLNTLEFEWHPLSTGATDTCMARDLELAEATGSMALIDAVTSTETFDLFCAGQLLTSDGEVLTVGGNYTGDSTLGSVCAPLWDLDSVPEDALAWDLATDGLPPSTWFEGDFLDQDRWYPTLTRLPDDRVLIAGGNPASNEAIEAYTPGTRTITSLTSAPDHPQRQYPLMFVLPNGHVIWAGGETSGGSARNGRIYNADTGLETQETTIPPRTFGQKEFSSSTPGGSAVSYAPGKIMKSGGGGTDGSCHPNDSPRPTTEFIDLSDPNDDFEEALFNFTVGAPMTHKRRFHSMNVLPDGKVLVTGGTGCRNGYGYERASHSCTLPDNTTVISEIECTSNSDCPLPPTAQSVCNTSSGLCRWDTTISCDSGTALTVCPGHCWLDETGAGDPGRCDPFNNACYAAKQAELWDPVTKEWHSLATAQNERMYHSSAMLLPDGRVLTAGNGRRGGLRDIREAELYYPPYLMDLENRPRPVVSSVQEDIGYDAEIRLNLDNASPVLAEEVQRISMIALGSVTHQNDMSQRFVELGCLEVEGGDVIVRSPHDANHAPPGWYMIFAISDQGTPSIGRYVRLGSEE